MMFSKLIITAIEHNTGKVEYSQTILTQELGEHMMTTEFPKNDGWTYRIHIVDVDIFDPFIFSKIFGKIDR
jgi:hypothetical protein